jgi:hypothetical protein
MALPLATPELRPRCFEIQSLSSSSTEVRDEGYSPSPNTEIDRDEGYSPSPDSVSIFWDQNSLQFFSVLPRTRELRLSSLHSSQVFLCPPCFLSFLPQQDCVWLEFPVRGQVWKPYRWVVCPIPSLTLEEVFPPTSLTVIHSWVRGLF